MYKSFFISIFSLLALFNISISVADPLIYLSGEGSSIARYDATGANREELLNSYSIPSYVTIDHTNGKFYWGAGSKVMRCSFDGSNFEVVYDSEDGVRSVTSVAVDPDAGLIYWTDYNRNRLLVANIDGTGTPSVLYSNISSPVGLVIDTVSKILYWGQQGSSEIYRGNASGVGSPQLVTTTGNGVTGIALDRDNGLLYWCNFNDKTIQRSTITGTNKTTIYNSLDGVDNPAGISVDATLGRIYYTNANGFVMRGSTNGVAALTQLYDISSTNTNCHGVAVTTDGTQVIFPGDRDIFRGDANGVSAENIILDLSNSVDTPSQIQVDVANNKLYFVNSFLGSEVSRIDLDFNSPNSGLLSGTIEKLYTSAADGIGFVSGLVIDTENSFIFWTAQTPKIQRGALDGSGSPVDLFDNTDGLVLPRDLVYASSTNTLFWIDNGTSSIMSGNADGTGTPTVLFNNADGVVDPNGLAVDPNNGKIYWGDNSSKKVLSGNIDGSGTPLTLFDTTDGISRIADIKLDLENNKIYITDYGSADALLRGNLDGSGILETLISSLNNLNYLELLSDTDGDGSPNGADGCENDSAKAAPGDCGCGEVDTDSNSNSISDCLLNADAKDRILTLRNMIRSLKFTGTPNRKKNRRRKKAQKDTLAAIKAIIDEINASMTTNLSQYNLVNSNANLAKLLKRAIKSANRARRTRAENFKRRKKIASKGLNKLNNALANS